MTVQSNIHFYSFTVQHVSLASFTSVSFVPNGVKHNRRNIVTVANPRALFARKDGKYTIQGSHRGDTKTVNLRSGVLRTVDHRGIVTEYNV